MPAQKSRPNTALGFDRPSETRDGRKISYSLKKDNVPGSELVYSSIGQRWANVANTPYRLWKAESYEGGAHTPMIAFWPKGITAPKGSFSKQVGHVMDFMATFNELAGAVYPATYKGHAIPATPGISLVPSFEGKATAGHRELFNEHFRRVMHAQAIGRSYQPTIMFGTCLTLPRIAAKQPTLQANILIR
ncbi:sulfatase-like hydrolase/transferase [Mucilaginibacter sp. S1162]|uniref:Sulfatase-like hydrolase/transferase n=1 Tax=Mucilaginibacter humi TaxID=2732510 RepID=A0ABX1VZF7_9SPHI|nr:sulfatase-like hydrolase/transferase [Mucilaginibacter humi]NNU33341.1 sulfatase-like hydrolase/transferase [Mucilaginibacter humi]